MRVSDRLTAPERERIVPGDSELACLIRDVDESQTDLEAPQYWPENLRLAGKKVVSLSTADKYHRLTRRPS